jgi:dTDP-D-glucose 4,6-dehydratase
MKKILVTGGCGFIGTNFIRYLLTSPEINEEISIINLDKQTYAGKGKNIEHLGLDKDLRYKFIKGDICDKEFVKNVFNEEKPEIIFNFAAESHVDNSIKNSNNFITSNVVGTVNLLDIAKENKIKKFIQISCYDEKTRALTSEGLKKYNELKEGDLVFSLNPVTREIELKPIEKVIIQEYNGKMIHFKNKRIDLFVTPNHNMFILNTANKLNIESAEEASKRSIFFMPKGIWKGKEEEDFIIEGYGKVRTRDIMYLLGIFIGDGFTAYQEKETETKTGLQKGEYLKLAKDKISGRFKKIEKQGEYKSISHGYRIFFDIPEEDKCRKRVEKTLANLGIKYNCHKGKAGTHLYFASQAFLNFFDCCGKGAYNKHIPKRILEYSPKYLKYLLEGLMDSDGHNNKIYHTVSETLVSDICELCIKLNLHPSIHKRHCKSFINGRKIEGDAYYIFIAKTNKSISKHKIKKIEYNGKVWCLKVKDNKNFIVERNGRFDFCGNTDEVYGSSKDKSFYEEDNLNSSSPYSSSKAAADLQALAYFKTHNLPVIITRSANNYGPYQFPEKILPLFITNLIEQKKVPLMWSEENPGLNIRDWLNVEDNCRAIWFISQNGVNGEIYNIPGENEKTNFEMTKKLLNYFCYGEEMIEKIPHRKAHDFRYSIIGQKLKNLGFEYKHKDLDNEIIKLIEWYKNNKEWWKPLKGIKKEKAIVFGAGYLGTRIAKKFNCELTNLNPLNLEALSAFLDKEKPNIVINAIGKTGRPNIDWCEENKQLTIESNVIAAANLCIECSKRDIYFVHLGSGCIYYGDNNGKGFSEEDEPNFYGPQFYAKSKILAEKILKEFPSLIIRLRMPIDEEPNKRNLIDKLLKYNKLINIQNSVTIIPDMLDSLNILIQKRKTGIYNIVNPGTISAAEIMEMYKQLIDSSHNFEILSLEELDSLTKGKRSNCVLNTEKLKSEGINLPEIHNAVRTCLLKYKGNLK